MKVYQANKGLPNKRCWKQIWLDAFRISFSKQYVLWWIVNSLLGSTMLFLIKQTAFKIKRKPNAAVCLWAPKLPWNKGIFSTLISYRVKLLKHYFHLFLNKRHLITADKICINNSQLVLISQQGFCYFLNSIHHFFLC